MDAKSGAPEKAQRAKSVTQITGPKRIPALINAREGYQLWAGSYDQGPNPLLSLETRTLESRLEPLRGRVLIDVACGTGRWMAVACEKGARAYGVDLSAEMLRVGKSKPGLGGCLVRGDACHLPFADACADVVMCSFALGYVSEPKSLFQELSRIARRGAGIFVGDLHPQALNAGWRRTFCAGSDLFEIESYWHSYSEWLRAGLQSSLRLRDVLEPAFGEPEHCIMRSVGQDHYIEATAGIPAILATIWERL